MHTKKDRPVPNTRLRHERELRGWTQEEVAERIGTTAVSVSRWENGTYIPDMFHRNKLCELYQKNPQELGFVSEKVDSERSPSAFEAPLGNDLTASTSKGAVNNPRTHSAVDNGNDLAENSRYDENTSWYATVSAERYYPLPRREQELEELQAALSDPQGLPIVVIDGLGGLGKTALAVELAGRLLLRRLFEGVVGDSAKQQLLEGEEIVQVRKAALDFDLLLDAIARQLGYWEIPTLNEEKKRAAIAHIFRQRRYLILVDNLEAAENARELVVHLRELLHASRALVTSRNKVHYSFVHPLSLSGLDLENALIFMRMELKQHRFQPLRVPEETLRHIHEVSGGAPLAMKLVVAQSTFLDLDVVLRRLRQAGSNLYPFIFRQSWEHLSSTAQHVLVYIGRTVMTTVGWDELLDAEIAESETELITAVDQLVTTSLLDVYPSPRTRHRYGMHQLTRQFVNSELPEAW